MFVVEARRPEWRSKADEKSLGAMRGPEREGMARRARGSETAERGVEAKREPRRLKRVTDDKNFHSTALGHIFVASYSRENFQ